MATSAQIQQKLADLHAKRAELDRKIGDAQSAKSKKDSEANARSASAARASADSTRRSYESQADRARKDALREGDKIASLSKDIARVSKDIVTQQKDLLTAQKSESAARKSEDDKLRRAREADQRKQDQNRKTEERKQQQERRNQEQRRQQERRDDERRRQDDLTATSALVSSTERRLAREITELRQPKAEKLRILYATASADPARPLRVDQEVKRVKAAVRASTNRNQVAIEYLTAATPSDVLDMLGSFRPHVVHFSGHANESALVFDEGDDGFGTNRGARLKPSLFKGLLESADEAPRLVVLNACESAAQLNALLGKVWVAVGMTDSINDGDAIVFATRFYSFLAEGQSVAAALRAARTQMEMNGLTGHDLPTLHHVEGVDPDDLRLITGD